jgi:hypothetical protein
MAIQSCYFSRVPTNLVVNNPHLQCLSFFGFELFGAAQPPLDEIVKTKLKVLQRLSHVLHSTFPINFLFHIKELLNLPQPCSIVALSIWAMN